MKFSEIASNQSTTGRWRGQQVGEVLLAQAEAEAERAR